jgi:hypothetical protein
MDEDLQREMKPMKRFVLTIAVAVFGAALTFAQTAKDQDPDRMVQGGGKLPAGWQARLDNSSAKLDAVKFEASGSGFHVTSGPAGIYFKPDQKGTGAYETHATFTQLEPAAHPEAYGLIIGGSDLQSENQKYTYFLIRQDGKFLIKKRDGASTPNVMTWTENAAIKKADASGKATNALSVEVSADKVRFLVNGTEVASQPRSQVDTNGIAGLRINHNLNVQVEGFGVKSAASH